MFPTRGLCAQRAVGPLVIGSELLPYILMVECAGHAAMAAMGAYHKRHCTPTAVPLVAVSLYTSTVTSFDEGGVQDSLHRETRRNRHVGKVTSAKYCTVGA